MSGMRQARIAKRNNKEAILDFSYSGWLSVESLQYTGQTLSKSSYGQYLLSLIKELV